MSAFRVIAIEPDPLCGRMLADALCDSDIRLAGVYASVAEASLDADLILVRATIVSTESTAVAALGRATGVPVVLYDASANVEALFAAAALPLRGFLAFNQLCAD